MRPLQTRRQALRKAGVGLTVGIGVLAGCSSKELSGEPISNRESRNSAGTTSTPVASSGTSTGFSPPASTGTVGELPIHESESRTSHKRQDLSASHTEIQEREAVADESGQLEFFLGGNLDAKAANGLFGMSAVGACGTYWRAPSDGEYTLSVTYTGKGNYTASPPENAGRDFTVSSGISLVVLGSPDDEVGAKSVRYLQYGNPGIDRDVAERLLEFMAVALVTPYLGLVGRIIARGIIRWAIDIPSKRPYVGQFRVLPRDPEELEVSFTAKEGHLYNFQLAAVSGFTMRSAVKRWAVPSVYLESDYVIDSISID